MYCLQYFLNKLEMSQKHLNCEGFLCIINPVVSNSKKLFI